MSFPPGYEWLQSVFLAGDTAVANRDASWPGRRQAVRALQVIGQNLAAAEVPDPADQPMVDESLTDVAVRFGLDAVDIRLLTFAVAAGLEPACHQLLGALSGSKQAGWPSVATVLELTGIGVLDGAGRSRLGPAGPLVRHGLVHVVGPGPMLSHQVRGAGRLIGHLTGDPTPDAGLLPLIGHATPAAVGGSAEIAAALRQGASLVWVTAAAGTDGMAAAAQAARTLQVRTLVVDLRQPHSSTLDVTDLVSAAVLEAALAGRLLILAGAELIPTPSWSLSGSAVPIVAISSRPWPAGPAAALPALVDAAASTAAQRAGVWAELAGDLAIGADVLALRLDAGEIRRIASTVVPAAVQASEPAVTLDRVRDVLRRLGPTKPAGAQPASMGDLVLAADTRAEVDRLVAWVRHRDDPWARALREAGHRGSGICALFSGSPGTGKTLTAQVAADTLGLELMTVELSTVVDKYVGETEKNLERVFAAAESRNALLFFDEADSLFGSRSAVKDAHDRYANQEVAFLLQRMEKSEGVTILATNLRGNLDPAFSRRLQFIVHFPDPDRTTREALWEHHLARTGLPVDDADPIDVPRLAGVEATGSDIYNMVLTAAFAAAADGSPLGMRHVRDALSRELGKLGRRVPVL